MMITKPFLTMLVISLLLCSGCAKNRWLSRRDYSEMHDPFMESEAVADADQPDRAKGDTVGRARLSNSLAESPSGSDSRSAEPLLGPKPIQQASSANDPEHRSGRIAKATYPGEQGIPTEAGNDASSTRSYEGPALSDFLQRKKSVTDATAATATTVTPRGEPSFAPSGSLSASPAATVSSMPKLSAEVEGFTSFLTEKGTAATTTATDLTQQGSNAVQAVEQDAGDFASWAQQKQETWSETGEGVADAVSAAPGRIQDDARAAAQQLQRTAQSAVPDFDAPDFSSAEDELAQPLMKRFDAQQPDSGFDPEFSAKTNNDPVAKKEVNPFDDPFVPSIEPKSEVTVAPRTASAAKTPSASGTRTSRPLDDSFQMDSGWKPAHLSRP